MFLISKHLKFKNIPDVLIRSKHYSIFKETNKFYSVNTSKDKTKKDIIYIKPKNYADANSNKEKAYYDFEAMTLKHG